MILKRFAVVLLLASSTAALAQSTDASKPKYGTWGVDYTSMDKSVKPGDDFFGYAEGSWLKATEIAPDKSRAGYNYDLPDETEEEVRAMVEACRPRPGRSSDAPDRRLLHCLDGREGHRGARDRAAQALPRADRRSPRIGTSSSMLMAEPGFAGPVGVGISADEKDPTHYTVERGPGAARPADARLLSAARAPSTTRSARPIATMSIKIQSSPASPTPPPRPTRSSRSRRRSPRTSGRPSAAAIRRRPTIR